MNICYILRLIKYKFFTKINNDYITFISFNGKYADSPRFLTEYINKLDKSKKIIWLVNDINNSEVPEYVTKVKYDSKEGWDYYCKSKVVIDNVYCMHEYYLEGISIISKMKYKFISFLKNKKDICYYTFWHGTPLKKMGIDSINSNIYDFSCPNTTIILDNEYVFQIMKRLTFNKLNYKLLGAPRNDLLFSESVDIKKLKSKLGLPNKKIIIYAPSFRTDEDASKNVARSGLNQISEMDIEKLISTLKEKFGDEWALICRFHYHVEKAIDWCKLKEKYGDKIINGNAHEDIVEYLKCSDILITDMSSTLFDFSLINKPVFLYFPDIDYYKNKERGLYINVEDLPFSCATTFEDLIHNIYAYDEKQYLREVEKFIDKLGYVDRKQTSEEIAKFILEDSNEKNIK